MEQIKQVVIDSLDPLFDKAQKENLWFNCTYQDLWFSPNELKEKHKEGLFVWGAVNWKLRNPQEHIDELENDKKIIDKEIEGFEKKMNSAKTKEF